MAALLVTVYVVVEEGVTVMDVDVLLLLQVLDVPPLTLRVTLWPIQIAVSRLMVVETYGFTVTVKVSILSQ